MRDINKFRGCAFLILPASQAVEITTLGYHLYVDIFFKLARPTLIFEINIVFCKVAGLLELAIATRFPSHFMLCPQNRVKES